MVNDPAQISFDQLRELALQRFDSFVKTIHQLVIVEKQHFDLIIGAGNTGLLMATLTEMVYQEMHLPCPPKLLLPILRYRGEEKSENLFDNSVLYPETEEQLSGQAVTTIQKVLFVDDEIFAGNSVKESIKLVLKFKSKHHISSPTECTIVAEDQGVADDFTIPNIQTKLRLFSEGREETSNVITYYLPGEMRAPIIQFGGDEVQDHKTANILLGLPIKLKDPHTIIPKFDYSFVQKAKQNVLGYEELHQQAVEYTRSLIQKSLHSIND